MIQRSSRKPCNHRDTTWTNTEETRLLLDGNWPEQLRADVAATLGPIVTVERLSGMSLSGVWRVSGAHASLIVKSGPSPAEARFYEQVAPSLRTRGVPIPALALVVHETARHWLVIEDIPDPLPASAPKSWQPNPRIVAILARLHATTRAQPPDLPSPPDHTWTDAMTQAALTRIPDLAPTMLNQLQAASAVLVEPWCWISGDPNPRNWGLRADGTPVLFDWELFGPGEPATDLAIIIPGLGDPATYRRVATAYHRAWAESEPLPWGIDDLAQQIAIAKVTTVVQLLEGQVTGTAQVGKALLMWLQASVPDWLATVHDFVTAGRS